MRSSSDGGGTCRDRAQNHMHAFHNACTQADAPTLMSSLLRTACNQLALWWRLMHKGG
jgi:hypothetical protein